MSISRRLRAPLIGGVLLAAALTASAIPAAAVTAPAGTSGPAATLPGASTAPGLPQPADADRATGWLVRQLVETPTEAYLPGSTRGSGDASDTAQSLLALAATDTFPGKAKLMLAFLEHNVASTISQSGDRPGILAFLILDARAYGVDPTTFGGTNLVARLMATMLRSGPEAGLFGSQDPTYTGAYRQGIALAALKAAKVVGPSVAPAVTWLEHQECGNGGWMAYRKNLAAPCPATSPETYAGPDTNSTALAVEGLVAQGVTVRPAAETFLRSLQSTDGGWSVEGGPSDPDSTALVIQALRALRVPFSTLMLDGPERNPVSALIADEFLKGGPNQGAFWFPSPPSPPTPNLVATEQAVPALEGLPYPFPAAGF